jgi:hypothetical protein
MAGVAGSAWWQAARWLAAWRERLYATPLRFLGRRWNDIGVRRGGRTNAAAAARAGGQQWLVMWRTSRQVVRLDTRLLQWRSLWLLSSRAAVHTHGERAASLSALAGMVLFLSGCTGVAERFSEGVGVVVSLFRWAFLCNVRDTLLLYASLCLLRSTSFVVTTPHLALALTRNWKALVTRTDDGVLAAIACLSSAPSPSRTGVICACPSAMLQHSLSLACSLKKSGTSRAIWLPARALTLLRQKIRRGEAMGSGWIGIVEGE